MPLILKNRTGMEIDDRVVREARRFGLWGETKKRLQRMVRRACPVTHKAGNRRFDNFLFHIHGNQLKSVRRVNPDTMEVIW